MVPSMQQRAFGSTGLSVAPLGIGSIGGLDDDTTVSLMERLLDAGCNLVDTAACYGDSESLIGRRLAHRRDDFVLVSKCGHHEILADGSMRSRAISMADIDQALTRLQTDHLDVMLLHSYDLEPLQQGDAIAVLQQAQTAGKIRWLGYSGDNERAEWAAGCDAFDVLECSLSIADQGVIARALAVPRERQLAVIAKRPLANAAWARGDQLATLHESVVTYYHRLQALAFDPADYACADMGELALRFGLSVPGVTCLIASSTSIRNQDRNLAALTAGPLSDEAYTAVRERWQTVATAASEWDGVN